MRADDGWVWGPFTPRQLRLPVIPFRVTSPTS